MLYTYAIQQEGALDILYNFSELVIPPISCAEFPALPNDAFRQSIVSFLF